jgi:hypothetical protein
MSIAARGLISVHERLEHETQPSPKSKTISTYDGVICGRFIGLGQCPLQPGGISVYEKDSTTKPIGKLEVGRPIHELQNKQDH